MMLATESDPLEIVSAETLERELNLVRGAAAGPLPGIFGPRSMTWRVNREAAIFLGAGRALLLQLAHPWVAAAVEQQSDTFANPIGRFHRTFSTVFTMVFGTLDQSLDAARRLHRRHAPNQRHVAIRGRTVPGRLLLLRKPGIRAALGARDTLGNGTFRLRACAARPHARGA